MHRQIFNYLHLSVFGIFACAITALAAESWNYGFFFTPFPAAFSALLLVFLIGATLSAWDLRKPIRWLGEPMPLAMRQKNLMREALLLLGTSCVMYLGFSQFVQGSFDCSAASINRAKILIGAEAFLYGTKRSERLMEKFADRAECDNRLDVAETFLADRWDSIRLHRVHRSVGAAADALSRLIETRIRIRQNHINTELP